MSILTIDIGNSRIKVYQYDFAKNLLCKNIVNTDKLANENYFNELLAKFERIDYLIYSSVVPELNDTLANFVTKKYQTKILSVKHNFICYSKKLEGYQNIGQDIISNAFMAGIIEPNSIIISLGTATVISVINDKKLEGVIIAPGIYSSLKGLVNEASQLAKIRLTKQKNNLGINTNQAISLGFVHGSYHLLNGFIAELKVSYDINKIIFSGGGSFLLENFYQGNNYYFKEELVNNGLLEIFFAKYYEK